MTGATCTRCGELARIHDPDGLPWCEECWPALRGGQGRSRREIAREGLGYFLAWCVFLVFCAVVALAKCSG